MVRRRDSMDFQSFRQVSRTIDDRSRRGNNLVGEVEAGSNLLDPLEVRVLSDLELEVLGSNHHHPPVLDGLDHSEHCLGFAADPLGAEIIERSVEGARVQIDPHETARYRIAIGPATRSLLPPCRSSV